jgi:hypothetical protein
MVKVIKETLENPEFTPNTVIEALEEIEEDDSIQAENPPKTPKTPKEPKIDRRLRGNAVRTEAQEKQLQKRVMRGI